MPSSSCQLIPYVVQTLNQVTWNSMLDVGCGWGKWGTLMREYGDKWMRARMIVGVEYHAPNLTPLHAAVYDRVIVGDIVETLPELGKFDVIAMVAVLVHMPMDVGQRLLAGLLEHCEPRVLVVTVPTREWPQEELDGNPREKHYGAVWTRRDFGRIAPFVACRDLPNGERVVALSRRHPVVVPDPYSRPALAGCRLVLATRALLAASLGERRAHSVEAALRRTIGRAPMRSCRMRDDADQG